MALPIGVVFLPWLAICNFLPAMFLGLDKRMYELFLLGDNVDLEYFLKSVC